MEFKLYILIVFSFFGFNTYGQIHIEINKNEFRHSKNGYKEALSAIKKADLFYDQEQPGAYQIALSNYLEAYTYNQNSPELNYKIGACYLYSVEKNKALFFLQRAYKAKPEVSPDITYLIGWALQLNYELDEAIEFFNKFKAIEFVPVKNSRWNPGLLVGKKIKECETAKELVKNPIRVFIDNLGPSINSKYADYAPLVSADESMLIFTSKRDETTGGALDPNTYQYYEDIYISYKDKRQGWTEAVNMRALNTTGHDASVGLSPDGQTLYTYKGFPRETIYESSLDGENWTKPKELNIYINSKYRETSASITYDGKYLYFVSNRPKDDFDNPTIGGYDIFISEKMEDDSWGPARNVGAPLNTEYDEEGVFMHPDGVTIYFSSDREGSMGGHDIFYSEKNNEGNWNEPINIGYPINTTDDDVFFVAAGNDRYAYYSSAREGGYGLQDIYRITFLGPEKATFPGAEDVLIASSNTTIQTKANTEIVEIKDIGLIIMKGVVSDAVNTKPVEAIIEIVDNDKNEIITTAQSNSITGRYLISLPVGKNYGIYVKAKGYLFYSENVDATKETSFHEVIKDFALNKILIEKKIILRNVFFDNASKLNKKSYIELDRLIFLMHLYPDMKVEIGGHTDNSNSLKSSTELSETMARTVANYLISKGINRSRISYKGYAYIFPLDTNETKEGRQRNNRIEFKIINNIN